MIKNLNDALNYILGKPTIENALDSVIEDGIKENADFQYKAGRSPKIVRTTDGKCCEWCNKMAGEYDYPCDEEVYRKHQNCSCIVDYYPGDGRVQNAHTKRWREENDDEIEWRKGIGLEDDITEPNKELNLFNSSDKMKLGGKSFNSLSDPMAEVMGAAIDRQPEELQRIKDYLESIGVKINESSNMGYGCISEGTPGTISMPREASISAWYHELKHACDDYDAGWDGVKVLWDPVERIQREIDAYQVEINLAKKYGWDDMAERLYKNLEKEINDIWKNAKNRQTQ